MTEDRYSKDQKSIIEDFQATFSSSIGKRVYNYLAQQSGFNDRIIPNGEITGFELGRRDLYLFIRDKMLADPNEQVQTSANPEEAE